MSNFLIQTNIPIFHLAYMKHVPLMRLRRIKNAIISISCRISKTLRRPLHKLHPCFEGPRTSETGGRPGSTPHICFSVKFSIVENLNREGG